MNQIELNLFNNGGVGTLDLSHVRFHPLMSVQKIHWGMRVNLGQGRRIGDGLLLPSPAMESPYVKYFAWGINFCMVEKDPNLKRGECMLFAFPAMEKKYWGAHRGKLEVKWRSGAVNIQLPAWLLQVVQLKWKIMMEGREPELLIPLT